MGKMVKMAEFKTNDGVIIKYIDTDSKNEGGKEWLVLLHGFTGSSAVWQRNIHALSEQYRVLAPDLRGHGESGKPKHGYHVSRLAMDLHELTQHIINSSSTSQKDTISNNQFMAIGGSLGCAILWSYAELFSTRAFKKMIFVDQSPLQNLTLDGWDSRFCNRGMNNPWAIASLQKTLELAPELAHRGTIAACLGYRYAPVESENGVRTQKEKDEDEEFFLGEAVKGDGRWLGKLMEDHTAKDWRDSIRASFGPGSGSHTRVLVVGSSRSGCFPAEGVMKIVELVNGGDGNEGKERDGNARGVVVDWGGHWCYWEDPKRFDDLVLVSPINKDSSTDNNLSIGIEKKQPTNQSINPMARFVSGLREERAWGGDAESDEELLLPAVAAAAARLISRPPSPLLPLFVTPAAATTPAAASLLTHLTLFPSPRPSPSPMVAAPPPPGVYDRFFGAGAPPAHFWTFLGFVLTVIFAFCIFLKEMMTCIII
ncbi:hypothetical protein SBOR_2415 [Sclerotinia borealis F-4128]|uniref:AB hydrolase-1 domain-containing protein n=1 Tax=Sclerotinia borealis (strain F-4128) TaxID=1432307 RepID=W9CRD3_SCLBF|nr:hypothetical protein SBOR_2415 [Sclerotinia borealis F-4128]